MKIDIIITYLLIAVGLTGSLTSCEAKSTPDKTEQNIQKTADTVGSVSADTGNIYYGLRNLALDVKAEDIGIKIPANETKVYGIIMDWNLGEGIATVAAFQTGEASVYLSSGGGFVGAGGHDNVKKEAVTFVNEGQKYLSNAERMNTTPLPEKDEVKFYLLTNKGKFVGSEKMDNLENSSSSWSGLFNAANKLMSEIRVSSAPK